MANFKLLIVDDNAINREILCDQMMALGYSADVAVDGMSALRMTVERAFDVLITDLQMPGMSGYNLARLIRDRNVHMPIIAITAHISENERVMCRDAGINEVVLKPGRPDLIDKVIGRLTKCAKEVRGEKLVKDFSHGVLPDLILHELSRAFDESICCIDASMLNRDIMNIMRELHSIKGAFAMVHEMDLVGLCGDIEACVKWGDFMGAKSKAEMLRFMVQKFLERRSAGGSVRG